MPLSFQPFNQKSRHFTGACLAGKPGPEQHYRRVGSVSTAIYEDMDMFAECARRCCRRRCCRRPSPSCSWLFVLLFLFLCSCSCSCCYFVLGLAAVVVASRSFHFQCWFMEAFTNDQLFLCERSRGHSQVILD